MPSWLLLALLAAPPQPQAPLGIPLGVRDAAGQAGFVAGPGGHVAALDLATGAVRWTSSEGAQPLLLTGPGTGQQVLALDRGPDGARLVGLDAASGAVVRRWPGVAVPPTSAQDGAAWREGDALRVRFLAVAGGCTGGAWSPACERHTAVRTLARFDLAAQTSAAEPDREPDPLALPAAVSPASLITDESARPAAWRAPDRGVAVARAGKGLDVLTWPLGGGPVQRAVAAPRLPGTGKGAPYSLSLRASSDPLHLYFLTMAHEPQGPRFDERWLVRGLDGALAADLPFGPQDREVALVGPVLLVHRARPEAATDLLVALDAHTGALRWQAEVRGSPPVPLALPQAAPLPAPAPPVAARRPALRSVQVQLQPQAMVEVPTGAWQDTFTPLHLARSLDAVPAGVRKALPPGLDFHTHMVGWLDEGPVAGSTSVAGLEQVAEGWAVPAAAPAAAAPPPVCPCSGIQQWREPALPQAPPGPLYVLPRQPGEVWLERWGDAGQCPICMRP